jgi:hypothetical protein
MASGTGEPMKEMSMAAKKPEKKPTKKLQVKKATLSDLTAKKGSGAKGGLRRPAAPPE